MQVLGLQQGAGNRAVSAMLQRQPGTLPAPVTPAAPDVLERARSLLSRSFADWAVTDDDAREALDLLASTGPQLTANARALGSTYITRLLDNLPADAKTGPNFSRLILALDPSQMAPYLDSLLSYGAFDWAITDAEAKEIMTILSSLPDAKLNDVAGRLSGDGIKRLLDNLPAAEKANPAYLRLVVRLGPDLVVPYLESLLSYGALDWAITDNDARQVFTIIDSLGTAQVAKIGDRLGTGTIARLLDNLPADVKKLPAYSQLVVSLGPDRVAPYLESLMSYGVFDWAVTDADVADVFNVLAVVPAPNLPPFISKIIGTGTTMTRLLDNAPKGEALTPIQKRLLKSIFDLTPDSRVDLLTACMATRFNIDVGKSTTTTAPDKPLQWDAPGLRRVWPVLDALPPAHVSQDAALKALARYTDGGTDTAGYYSPGGNEAAMTYDPTKLGDLESGTFAQAGDPLFGANVFDSTVRHEVGHAVDQQMGNAASAAPKSSAGWVDYGSDYDKAVAAMIDDANSGIKNDLTSDQRDGVAAILKKAMSNESAANIKTSIQALGWWAALAAAKKARVLNDPAISALGDGFAKRFWNRKTGATQLGGGHVYQADGSDWTRYDVSALARKVSYYQWRSPAEWFAECYAAYYEPDGRGLGAKLNDRDLATKVWFDGHVHTLAASK